MNWRDDSGLSVTELLIVVTLLGVVLAAGLMVAFAADSMTDSLSARAMATDEAQVFLDTVGKELRQADATATLTQSGVVGVGAFATIGDRDATFFVDLNHDGYVHMLHYYVSNGSVYRTDTVSTTNSWPGTLAWGATSAPKRVIQKIDPTWNGSIFTFLTNDSLPPTQITQASDMDSITAVTVDMVNSQTWRTRDATSAGEITVRIRAIGSAF